MRDPLFPIIHLMDTPEPYRTELLCIDKILFDGKGQPSSRQKMALITYLIAQAYDVDFYHVTKNAMFAKWTLRAINSLVDYPVEGIALYFKRSPVWAKDAASDKSSLPAPVQQVIARVQLIMKKLEDNGDPDKH